MKTEAIPYKKQIFVCINKREEGICCMNNNSEAIRLKLKEFTKKHDLGKRVRVSQAKCLDQCSTGPTVMIYPDNIWYSQVTLDDADKIIEKHIKPYLKDAQ